MKGYTPDTVGDVRLYPEGFDTLDLKKAKTLLGELTS